MGKVESLGNLMDLDRNFRPSLINQNFRANSYTFENIMEIVASVRKIWQIRCKFFSSIEFDGVGGKIKTTSSQLRSEHGMSEPEAAKSAERPLAHSRKARLWLKELPYITVLALTILGVAYTSISHQPLVGYWEFLALAMGVVCIGTGWLHAHTKEVRFRMLWTQVLHWLAFLGAMNILVLSDVQKLLTAPGTGLALLMLLALGTFVAGIHVSWQICVLGIAMALAVPAIAWLTSYALFLVLVVAALAGIAMTFMWRQGDEGPPKLPASGE